MPAGVPPLDPAGFEALYRKDPDPWRTWTSPFEAHKRRMLIAACGPGGYGRVLELGCGVGANTAELARRALRVDAVDASPAAVKAAARRLMALTNVRLYEAVIPDELRAGRYDLTVVAELAYYLSPAALNRLCSRLLCMVAPGGRIILLHHRIAFSDAAQRPWVVHKAMISQLAPDLRPTRRLRFPQWDIVELQHCILTP